MNMISTGRCLLIACLVQAMIFSCAAQTINPPPFRILYRQAEKWYTADDPTPHTDSAALAAYLRVAAMLERQFPGDDSILFDSYVKSGILQLSFRSPAGALPLFRDAIRTAGKDRHFPAALLFKPFLYIGSCLYDAYDLDSALFYYRLAEDILHRCPALTESERLYNKVGGVYYESGDYLRSIQYFSKALDIVSHQRQPDTLLLVNYQNNIASALLKMKDFDKAIAIYKRLLPYRSYRDELLYNIGTAYLDAGDINASIRWLLQVQKNSQAKYNSLARAWLRLDKYDEAARNLQLAMDAYRRSGSSQKSQDLANTLKYTGDLLLARDSPVAALARYQQAILQLDRDFKDPSPAHNPAAFYGFHNSFLLFDALVAKARAWLAIKTADADNLRNAFSAYSAALGLARHVETMYYTDEARLFLVKKVDTVYKEMVSLGHRLFQLFKDPAWLEKIFLYEEAGKASVLQARLGDPGPHVLQGQGRDLYVEARKKRAEAAKLNLLLSHVDDSAAAGPLQDKIRDIELQISSLQEKMDQLPEYRRRKFAFGNVSIRSIQKSILTKDHALLSYYYTGRELFCFYVTSESFGCVISPRPPSMSADVRSLRQQLDAGAVTDRQALQEMTRVASHRLIDPVYDKIRNKTRLIVIPYDEIAYLPFEMLQNPVDHRQLVRDFSISYDYSANFVDRTAASALTSYQVLALAPFSAPGGLMPQLKSSPLEIRGLPGTLLLGDKATRSAFLYWLPHYPIIHLATHAVVNDRDPLRSYIEFYSAGPSWDDSLHRLFEEEIYHLDMDSTALVILSACETGSGSLVDGEGLISLSRAFSYAGCKSVITSLWRADDAATAFIASRLHHHLLEGEPRDRALQLAKLDYLDDPGVELRYKTPSFWAHLVLLGDYKPVAEKGPDLWLLIGCIIFLLFLAVRCIIGRSIV